MEGAPDEILWMIFSYLGPREWGRLCCTAKRLRKIASAEGLWGPLFQSTMADWCINPAVLEGGDASRIKLKSCSLVALPWSEPGKEDEHRNKTRKDENNEAPGKPDNPMASVASGTTLSLAACGAENVGKSAIVIRFVSDTFDPTYDPTIEDSYRKPCTIEGVTIFAEVLDPAGRDEYAMMRPVWIRSAEAFLLVYSITSHESLEKALQYYAEIVHTKKLLAAHEIPFVLAGCKSDLEADRQVSTEDGQAWADRLGMPFFEVSAKEGRNAVESIMELLRECAAVKLALAMQPQRSQTKLVSPNGSTYSGDCDSGTLQPDGQGECVFSEVDNPFFASFTGLWRGGVPAGHGVLRLRRNGISYSGVWRRGLLIGKLVVVVDSDSGSAEEVTND